ncbi:unnamed protein product [Linum tenue]|uniref:Uncharacterized protein n=1 Tax=Linum tenue TaxID=586396 RepID=A0AAV0HSJ2_9ROSI|nr:unnamed protein product [Linum tenue]
MLRSGRMNRSRKGMY